MAPLWQKHGLNKILQIVSLWILIIVPRDGPCQISHCWVYPLAPFPRNVQNMALYGQNIVNTWSRHLWPKQGPHLVLKIVSSWIFINVSRDDPCQISHCWVYPVVPFLENGQNMALLWPKNGPHTVLQVGYFWISINVPKNAPCQISES